jgi:pilus assembly protein CpaF
MADDEITDPNQPMPQAAPIAPNATAPRMPDMGIIAPLMKDPEITEIMINDTRNIMVEKGGKIFLLGTRFQAIDELNRLTRNILDLTGRVLSPDQPYVDTMLPDGSRVNIVAPPLTQNGACLTIRKFPFKRFTLEDLVRFEMLSSNMAVFLQSCVLGRANILISGGTGTGKTTVLNALASLIPRVERIVTIEDTPELLLSQENIVSMKTKPQMPASPPITARELVANSLRMRPDRVILGECRRGEAFDMLQAMNTGHEGSMTTIHANSFRDALARLETLCMMSGVELPLLAIRKQIDEALDIVVQIKRFRDGKRKIVSISELTGMEGDVITTQDIYLAGSPDGDNVSFDGTGLVPTLVRKLRENGVALPPDFFKNSK